MVEGLERLIPIALIFAWGFLLGRAVYSPKQERRGIIIGAAIAMLLVLTPQLVELPREIHRVLQIAAVVSLLIGMWASTYWKPQTTA